MARRLLPATAVAALAVLASGCYVSLHPLVTEELQTYEPALVGAWGEKGETRDRWVFKPDPAGKPRAYIVEITEHEGQFFTTAPPKPMSAEFRGRLGRFGDVLVLELRPADDALGALKDHAILHMTLVPAAAIFRVRLAGGVLTLEAIDDNWLGQQIVSKKVRIGHEHIEADPNPHEAGQKDRHAEGRGPEDEDWVLLTAPTSELQALVRRYGTVGLFDEKDPGEFVRKRIQKYRLEADYGRDFVLTEDALGAEKQSGIGFLPFPSTPSAGTTPNRLRPRSMRASKPRWQSPSRSI